MSIGLHWMQQHQAVSVAAPPPGQHRVLVPQHIEHVANHRLKYPNNMLPGIPTGCLISPTRNSSPNKEKRTSKHQA